MSDSSVTRRRSPLIALQHRDFRLLWTGNVLSMVGTQMRIVAINYQLYQLTHDALSLGYIGLTRFIPLLLLGVPAGLVADRVNRRVIMMITQAVMMTCSATLCLLTWRGHITRDIIYTILTVMSIASTFDLPARQALIPSLVPREHLPNALGLNVTGWQAASVAGPAIAGFMLQYDRLATIYLVDATSFVATLTAIALLRYRHQPPPEDGRLPPLAAAREGLRFVFGNPLIRTSMLLDFFATFFGQATTMMPIFADQIIHTNRFGLGMMYAAPSVGSVLAGLIVASYDPLRRQGPLMLTSVAMYGVFTALFGICPWLWVSLILLAGGGAADTLSAVVRNTIRQLNTPDEIRGRMTSVNMLFFIGGPQLGEVEAGLAAHLMGAGPSVVAGGLACAACVAAVTATVPQLRRYDQ